MINKSLDELEKDKNIFEEEYNKLTEEDERQELYQSYIEKLKVYLFEANNFIKNHFKTTISPFISIEGRNALNRGSANHYFKKSKEEFLKELNSLISSDVYNRLDEDNKKRARTALYILKTYYENNLE